MTPTHLESCAITHPGLERDNNEDAYLSRPELGLWLVADGMGGHEAGEVASAIARDTIDQTQSRHPNAALSDTIQAAHRAILVAADKGIGAQGMGSTLVALKNFGKHYQVAWVGDSRAYLWTLTPEGGQLERLSKDHSYVQLLIESGAISADEAEKHPEKNIITQCLGMQELKQVRVDTVDREWQPDQWVLLCSDGLSDEINDATISQVFLTAPSSKIAGDQLLQTALSRGGHDNITLQIIESPIKKLRRFSELWRWVPYLTHNRDWDVWIFGGCIILLLSILMLVSMRQ